MINFQKEIKNISLILESCLGEGLQPGKVVNQAYSSLNERPQVIKSAFHQRKYHFLIHHLQQFARL